MAEHPHTSPSALGTGRPLDADRLVDALEDTRDAGTGEQEEYMEPPGSDLPEPGERKKARRRV